MQQVLVLYMQQVLVLQVVSNQNFAYNGIYSSECLFLYMQQVLVLQVVSNPIQSDHNS